MSSTVPTYPATVHSCGATITYEAPEIFTTLPTRAAMRAPHKSRHTAARFTTRNGRRGTSNEVGR